MQPFLLPSVTTFKKPLPLNAEPVGVGPELVLVAEELAVLDPAPVELGGLELAELELPPPPEDPLGKYLIPVLGHELVVPTGGDGTNCPVCTLPFTLKKYQTSSRAPFSHPR